MFLCSAGQNSREFTNIYKRHRLDNEAGVKLQAFCCVVNQEVALSGQLEMKRFYSGTCKKVFPRFSSSSHFSRPYLLFISNPAEV